MATKTLKLSSLNPAEYPDIEVECEVIDDMKAYAEALIEYQKSQGVKVESAKKTGRVTARLGKIGEEFDTRRRVRRDGKVYVIGETKGKVKVEGSMIVQNPDGEEYIVKPDKFDAKYKATETPGVYEPKDQPIKYIPITKDITFLAPWGEEMFGVKGAVLNVSNLDDIYAIQNEAFEKTYTPVKQEKTK